MRKINRSFTKAIYPGGRRVRKDALPPRLWIKAKIDPDLRGELIKKNRGLAVRVARKYLGRGVDFEDLVQIGLIALDEAIKKFDPARGYRFSTLATWIIRSAVSREVANKGRTIRLPVYASEKLGRVMAVFSSASEAGESPSLEELVKQTGLLPIQIRSAITQALPASRTRKLDETPKPFEDLPLRDLCRDLSSPNPELVALAKSELGASCRTVVRYLGTMAKVCSKRNFEIFLSRFGLRDSLIKRSIHKVAEDFKVSPEWVRNLSDLRTPKDVALALNRIPLLVEALGFPGWEIAKRELLRAPVLQKKDIAD